MTDKSPNQLIEERIQEMDKRGSYVDEKVYRYHCMSTGMVFETRGEPAQVSPFTGKNDIVEQDFQQMKDVPANQKDPMKQTPLMANPTPPDVPPANWQNTPWAPNPAPDAQSTVGATSAGPQGFVPYPQQSAPPHVNKNPGERT